jgi:hypothetical protein
VSDTDVRPRTHTEAVEALRRQIRYLRSAPWATENEPLQRGVDLLEKNLDERERKRSDLQQRLIRTRREYERSSTPE